MTDTKPERWQEIVREMGNWQRDSDLDLFHKSCVPAEPACKRIADLERMPALSCDAEIAAKLGEATERIAELESDRKELSDALDIWRQGHESTQEMLRTKDQRIAELETALEDSDQRWRDAVARCETFVAALAKEKARAAVMIALVNRAASDSIVTTSDGPGCFFCDHEKHREDCPARPFLKERGDG